jgi:hypothetical protein
MRIMLLQISQKVSPTCVILKHNTVIFQGTRVGATRLKTFLISEKSFLEDFRMFDVDMMK